MLLLSLDGSWIGTHLASLQPNDASLVPGMMTPVSIWPLVFLSKDSLYFTLVPWD